MDDRYEHRHLHDRDRREQRAGSWRDEGPDRYWVQRERFGSDRGVTRYDDDAGFRGGTWSAGHGGGTEHGYSGGFGSWQPQYNRDEHDRYLGRGPKNYRRSDERIFEDVSENLTADPYVDASDIEVFVHDGEVKLEGTVETRHEKRLAEDCAWNVSGVREVHNRLRVNMHDRAGERGGALRV